MTGVTGTYHWPVMVSEVLESLGVHPGGTYIDCTLGDGGHSVAILEAAAGPGPEGKQGRLLGLDADPEAIVATSTRLAPYGDSAVLVNTNFEHLEEAATDEGFVPADGVLFDLGLSSRQLDAEDRGFSFRRPDTLDMRFSAEGDLTASVIVNEWPEEEIANLIYRFGEEPRSRRIARAIVRNRTITDAKHLANVVARAAGYKKSRSHPATRTFQALRMGVNHEIESLQAGLDQAASVLDEGGRLVTISYHSLEDREIKRFVVGSDRMKAVVRKVIKPSKAEVERNPRSRSAKLRVVERLAIEPDQSGQAGESGASQDR
jgi:16S rRNA (cytosine1402-N4)-methyltransferase